MTHCAAPPQPPSDMSHDLAIARASPLRPIAEIAERAGIPLDALDLHGRYMAKLERPYLDALSDRPDGKLVLVTAMSPTPRPDDLADVIPLVRASRWGWVPRTKLFRPPTVAETVLDPALLDRTARAVADVPVTVIVAAADGSRSV